MRSVLVSLVALSIVSGAERKLDHSAWNQLLGKYVNQSARVDYAALKAHDLTTLDSYLSQLAQPWPNEMSAPETKAALIGAYNAITVRWILGNYPTESIWRTQHPFTEARHHLNGATVSLDQIETRLRALGDPRIHAALVCASLSCPPLRREAYEAPRLDVQLHDNVRAWLANERLNRFIPERHTARVSLIFKWYADDFRKSYGSVENFLAQYGPAGKSGFLLQPGAKLEYLPYSWGLNDTSDIGQSYSALKFYRDVLRNKL